MGNLIKKGAEKVGRAAGQIVGGAASGLVKGAFGEATPEQKYKRQVDKERERLGKVAIRVTVAVLAVIALHYLMINNFENLGFAKFLNERGVIFLAPILACIAFVCLSENVAKNRVNRRNREETQKPLTN